MQLAMLTQPPATFTCRIRGSLSSVWAEGRATALHFPRTVGVRWPLRAVWLSEQEA